MYGWGNFGFIFMTSCWKVLSPEVGEVNPLSSPCRCINQKTIEPLAK
jgi:hypothetical protein